MYKSQLFDVVTASEFNSLAALSCSNAFEIAGHRLSVFFPCIVALSCSTSLHNCYHRASLVKPATPYSVPMSGTGTLATVLVEADRIFRPDNTVLLCTAVGLHDRLSRPRSAN
jgi:hypothetical protein